MRAGAIGGRLRSPGPLALGLLLAVPVAIVFHEELGSLPETARLLAAACALAIVAVAAQLMARQVRALGAAKLVAIALATALGVLLCSLPGARFSSADHARLNFSDGTFSDQLPPSPIVLWGKSVSGYALHPAYGSARVPNQLLAEFTSAPAVLKLWLSKPSEALLQPDGSPIPSDGVSVELQVFDSGGQLRQSRTYQVSEDEFLASRWVGKTIYYAPGISRVQLTVGTGPPGSTASYDSTLVAFEAWDLHVYGLFLAKVLLASLAFLNVALLAAFSCRGFSHERLLAGIPQSPRRLLPGLLILALLLALAYWSVSRTSFVYFWDYRNYWQKTEALYALMASGDWRQTIALIAQSHSDDYSMLPAILPALFGLAAGYPTRTGYALMITGLYALPAYLLVAYLGKRLLERGVPPAAAGNNAWIYACLPVFFGIPTFFNTTLNLMPDIGGVALFVAALLCAEAIVREIARQPGEGGSWEASTALIRSSLGLGVAFSLMFVFRRWYVFAAVGIACSSAALIAIDWWANRMHWRTIAQRVLVALVLGAFAALPFLSWIAFAWSKDIGEHDYANLYSSYRNSHAAELLDFVSVFGLIVIAIVSAVVLLSRRFKLERRLFFILLTSTLLAGFLFLLVQSPGKQHYYLLMPLFGGCLAALSIFLYRSYGLFASGLLTAMLIAGNAAFTWTDKAPRPVGAWFPGYGEWLPKQQPYRRGYEEIASWLLLPANKAKSFCVVASSPEINQGIFAELWQVVPEVEKGSYGGRLVLLGQVDSRKGPPSDAIRQCEILLVGLPFQTHLQPGEQYGLQIIQQDLTAGTGIAGAFARPAKAFAMDRDTSVLAYERRRQITDAEYADLVERYLRAKQARQSKPAR